MKKLVDIYDPRSDTGEGTDSRESRPLGIYMPSRDEPIRDSILLCNLLSAFPADMILYFADGPPKKIAKIWPCFTPEHVFVDRLGVTPTSIGVTPITDASRLGLTNFFDLKGSWFEWYFAVFDGDQLPAIQDEISNGLDFTQRTDPLAKHARYSFHCNRDMGHKEILVFDSQLFDPMIEFVNTLCS